MWGRRQRGGRRLKVTIKQADVRNEEEGGVRDASEISAGVGAAFTGEKTGEGMGIQRLCWEFEDARASHCWSGQLETGSLDLDLGLVDLHAAGVRERTRPGGEGQWTAREGDGRWHSGQQWIENSLQQKKGQGARRESRHGGQGRARRRGVRFWGGRGPEEAGRVTGATCSGLWEAVEVQPDYGGWKSKWKRRVEQQTHTRLSSV